MNKIECSYCNKLINKKGFTNHIRSCERIYKNKEYLISRYNETNNLYTVACQEHINYKNLSYVFKDWNIKLNIDDNGLPERKYVVNDNFFDKMTEFQYWFIGLIASDGSKLKHNQITLSQSGDNGLKLIEYINKLLSSTYPIEKNKTIGKDAFRIIFTSKKITKELEKYNIIRNKTYSYTLPKIPDKYLNAFLAGYIEGDGCITISNNGLNCNYLCASFVGTKNFIFECKDKIPIDGSVRKHNLSSVYEIRWNGEKAIEFCDWLYSYDNLYHSYKYENYIKAKEDFKNTRKERYKVIKNKILDDFINGKVDSITKYAKIINIPFQTIYNWKKKWEKEGLI